MPLAFLAPLFLGALSLVAVPWLIHQIRRPEREPLRFSSIMFIPKIDRKVIERRRIQHLILMLLRMALLVLLALAFGRPYLKALLSAPSSDAPGRHLVLLDSSYSMGTLDMFTRAKREARAVIGSMGREDEVGLIAFADRPRLIAALRAEDDPEVGRPARAQSALERAQLTEAATAYMPALQMAQVLLLEGAAPGGDDSEEPKRLVVHLISDFQKGGMPEEGAGWKLSPAIELHCIAVGDGDAANHSISDLGIRKMTKTEIRVQGKIKNWSESEEKVTEVRLVVNDIEREVKTIKVRPKSASQASFRIQLGAGEKIEGWLEIGADALQIDNRRYFVWNPPRKKQVLLVADDRPDKRLTAARFLTAAFARDESMPWRLNPTTQGRLGEELQSRGSRPDLIMASDLNGLESETVKNLTDYAREGGQVLLTLNASLTPGGALDDLLEQLGLVSEGHLYRTAREDRYETLSWVDFDHPIFLPFRGAKHNDFSQIRFYNYHRLRLTDPNAAGEDPDGPRVIARFEGGEGEQPAIVEAPLGQGRFIVWAFGADLDWTSLPKSVKFAPMLYESLAYMTGVDERRVTWRVGERYTALPTPSGESGRWVIQFPHEQESTYDASKLLADREPLLARAGFMRWKSIEDADFIEREAVNIEAREADPTRIGIEEFELKLTAAPVAEASSALPDDAARRNVPEGFVVKAEYWHALIALFFAFLLLESWYAFVLIR